MTLYYPQRDLCGARPGQPDSDRDILVFGEYNCAFYKESSQASKSASRFQRGDLAGPQLGIDLFQCLPFCLQTGLGVVVRGIEAGMAQPAPDHGDINTGGNQMDRGRVAKHVGRDPLPR